MMRTLLIIAALLTTITTAHAKTLPACDNNEVKATFVKLRHVVKGMADISELGGNDTKRMCSAYYYGQTGMTNAAYQEAVFSLEWINEDNGEWWLQVKSSQSIYKGPTKAGQ